MYFIVSASPINLQSIQIKTTVAWNNQTILTSCNSAAWTMQSLYLPESGPMGDENGVLK